MDNTVRPQGFQGGEGATQPSPSITYDEFRFYCLKQEYDQRWITRIWRVMVSGSMSFSLRLMPDADSDPRALGVALDRSSVINAPMRAWESPRDVWHNTGLKRLSCNRLIEWRESLKRT